MRLEPGALPLAGLLACAQPAGGGVLTRLPAWALSQVPDPMFALVAKMPAGARLELHTDAESLELDVKLTIGQVAGEPPITAGFDLVVDGVVVASQAVSEGDRLVVGPGPGDYSIHAGAPTTVVFRDLPRDPAARIEVWLPHRAAVDLLEVRLVGATTFRAAAPHDHRWVHYGSSISHCLEAAQPTEAWPSVVALAARWDLVNLGLAANCHLDQAVARLVRDTPADLVTVKAGINVVGAASMRERTFVPALHGFLDTVRDGHPTTPVVLVTPIVCPPAEDHAGLLVLGGDSWALEPLPPAVAEGALSLRRARDIVGEVVAERRRQGDGNLHLLDGLDLFGADDVGDLPDALHPSPAGYRRIGERFHRRIIDLCQSFTDPDGSRA